MPGVVVEPALESCLLCRVRVFASEWRGVTLLGVSGNDGPGPLLALSLHSRQRGVGVARVLQLPQIGPRVLELFKLLPPVFRYVQLFELGELALEHFRRIVNEDATSPRGVSRGLHFLSSHSTMLEAVIFLLISIFPVLTSSLVLASYFSRVLNISLLLGGREFLSVTAHEGAAELHFE